MTRWWHISLSLIILVMQSDVEPKHLTWHISYSSFLADFALCLLSFSAIIQMKPTLILYLTLSLIIFKKLDKVWSVSPLLCSTTNDDALFDWSCVFRLKAVRYTFGAKHLQKNWATTAHRYTHTTVVTSQQTNYANLCKFMRGEASD